MTAVENDTARRVSALRVLVVWCPDWPIAATCSAAEAAGPVAVVEGGRVLACSNAAREAGVRRGQRLRFAHRLCPELRLRERDPEAETRRFEPVVAAVEAFTPRVEVVRPGLCAIQVKGPARYFGGEEALVAAVARSVEEVSAGQGQGPADGPRVGVADGVFAGVLAARAGEVVPAGRTAAFLAPYPVGVLDDEPLAGLLVRLGVSTLGDFAALPSATVADRFGPAGLAAYRLAQGLEARPPATRPPGLDLTVEQLFDPPELLAEPLVFVARTLAERLHSALAGAGLACRRVGVEVTCADGRTARRLWQHEGRLPAPALAERVRWQLQAWQGTGFFAPESGGFTALRLVPDELVANHGRQLALWGQALVEDRVERAAARVQALLGYDGLSRIEPAGGRGPGEVLVRVPWGDHPPPAADRDAPWPGQLGRLAPPVVLPVPTPVAVLDADGVPVRVTGRAEVSAPPARLTLSGRTFAVTGWAGPWPAVERWWDPGSARRRARFQVALADGRALLLVVEDGGWAVEAAYA
ncbi:protein ImuB [Kitasatospora sp. MAA4]|uniref:DNA polymerase Y family protein n=1 Tax=Kitasatospora sp. MAA4 TaxID=3035093 RepID=UPI002475058C|nr:DNA polymerase Y family protein [Kitasatospora sp. MAA4]MDH6133514.1 protein ImuB [Kitasatospora sp. MAA4]